MNKRGEILVEHVIFIILNLIFLGIMIVFLTNQSSGSIVLEEVYDEVKKDIEKDGSLLISKSYKNVDEKLEIRCRCGKSFKRSYYGYRISNRTCGCDNQTRGNKEVESFLIKNNIPYEKEYEFEDLKKLRFDFKIEHKNKICLIEYDGWFHFNNHARWNQLDRQQKADSRKNEYCIKKNIELIRIKYDSDSVEDKLKHLI